MTMMTSENFDADVALIGLGPTGLVLAHILGGQGHRVVVLEREPRFYGNARAVYTDDECMRIFQSIGMAQALQAKMMPETPVQFVRPDGSVMGQYRPLSRPFGWPVVNFFYQPYLETALTHALARHPNVSVLRGRELVDFTQDPQGVRLTHQATQEARFAEHSGDKAPVAVAPDPQTLRVRYLVGCDGGRSTVRARLGIEMTGRNFPEPWLVVDLRRKPGCDGLRHLPYFNFVVDPALPVVSCTQPDGFHRFEFMLMPGETKENMERPETVRHYLSRFVDPDHFEVMRRLVYTFNALMARQWRQDRVLLAGDAAHMTPQFMGQGASSGIRDAYNLGWKLDLVLKGHCRDTLLDSYERERKAHAQSMIDVSVMLKDVVSMTHPVGTRLRDLGLRLLQATPLTRRWLTEGRFKPKPRYARGSYLGLRRRRLGGPEGTLAPQPEVRCLDGRRVLLDEALGPGFALVGLGIDPRTPLDAASLALLRRLDARHVALYPYGERPQGPDTARDASAALAELEDIGGEMLTWLRRAGCRRGSVAILRPDRFAFGVVPARQLNAAVRELARQLSLNV